MEPFRVVAIVVNWNLKEDTLSCLQSLERLDFPCRIIVVDNGSSDDSAEYLVRRISRVEVIKLPTNLGFGAACNCAITWALQDPDCDLLLLLNNDAIIDPHALAELMEAAQANPRVGIFGPKVYYMDVPDVIWYAGAYRRRRILAAVDVARGQVDYGQFSTSKVVDYVFGAAMLVRRNVFEQIGLFDEQFFLYLEDLDFCLRAQRANFSLLFVPTAHIWHKVSASTATNQMLRKYYLTKSTIRFLKKHISLKFAAPALIFWLLVLLREILTDLSLGHPSAIRAYWSGLIDGVTEAHAHDRLDLPAMQARSRSPIPWE